MEPRQAHRLSLIASAGSAVLLLATAASAQPSDPPAAPAPQAPPAPAAAEPIATAPAPGAPPPAVLDAEPSAPAEPPEVTVLGTRARETGGSAHVVSSKQLERFEYDDAHQVLRTVPGIYFRGEDGFGLRPNIGMRGAISDRSKKITLTEDGILFGPAPYSAPAAYYFPLVTRMHAVRVLKGPATIAMGPHTVAGAIDFVTAPVPETKRAMVDLAFGQYLSRKVHIRAGMSDDDLGVLVEGVHLGNSGFKELDGGGDTGFSRNELMLKARYAFDSPPDLLQELELKVGYSNEYSNETYLGITDADFEQNPYRRYGASRLDRMEWHRTAFALTHVMQRGPSVTLTTTAYRNDLHRVWHKVNGFRGADLADVLTNPTDPRNAIFHAVLTGAIPPSTSDEALLIGPNDRDFVSQGVQTTLRFSPRTGCISHKLELGARIHHDGVSRLHSEQGYLVEGTSLTRDGEGSQVTAENEASTLALAMYALDAATWGPLTVTAGARLESIQGKLDDVATGRRDGLLQQVVLPGAGVFLALPLDLGLLGGVHQGFSPIPPGQSELVRPEKSISYEWGARFSPRQLRAEVIGFYNDYQNLSNVCTFSSGCAPGDLDQQFDGGEARVYGLEAYVQSELQVREELTLPGRVAYTLTRASFANTFTSADPIFGDVEEGDELPYVPTHQISVSAGVETRTLAVNVAGTYVSEMREVAGQGDPAEGEVTDAPFLLDASVSVKPLPRLTFYVTGKNLLDRAYIASRRPFGARPGAPLWIQGGAKLEVW